MAKWFKSFSWWMKLKITIGLFGAGGEITMIVNDALPEWHAVTIAASILAIAITHLIQDKDNNNVVDLFQKKNKSDNDDGKVN